MSGSKIVVEKQEVSIIEFDVTLLQRASNNPATLPKSIERREYFLSSVNTTKLYCLKSSGLSPKCAAGSE